MSQLPKTKKGAPVSMSRLASDFRSLAAQAFDSAKRRCELLRRIPDDAKREQHHQILRNLRSGLIYSEAANQLLAEERNA